jgi:hypothetical protein
MKWRGKQFADRLQDTQEEATLILQDMGIIKPFDPRRVINELVEAGTLVSVGDGLYHFSDEAAK